MHLYLVQHAHAKAKEADPEQRLSDEGWSEIRKVAAFVETHTRLKAQRILHSGKTRAHQTATVLTEYVKPPDGMQSTDGLKPMDDPAIWAQRLRNMDEDTILVGHLPHLESLAGMLLCGSSDRTIVKFRKAGVVCLCREEDGSWSVCWMVTPDLLK